MVAAIRPASGIGSGEEIAYQKQYKELKREEDEKRLVQLKQIQQVLDKLDVSPEVLRDYAILAGAYSNVGGAVESENTYQQLDDQIQEIGGMVEQLKEWFLPLFRDRIALPLEASWP